MKGIHIGIEAAATLQRSQHAGFTVDLFGAGPERAALGRQVDSAGLSGIVDFRGTLAYPQPFLAALRAHGVVLLTNLNDEQPRLIFDAISQGAIPVCPETPAYKALGLPTGLLYKVGDSESLARAIDGLWQCQAEALREYWNALFEIAERFTLDSMHAERAAWVRNEVLGR